MRYPAIFLYIVLLLITEAASGQYYETGQDPASLKWMQIKTGRFTVIYPEKYGSGGSAYAKSLEEAYSKLLSLFPEKKFKIPVIIHNFTTQSNGYVAWAPRRMELYPTPEQNTIPLSPEKQLALHELTHVFQMKSLNSGFSKAMSMFLGEQFTGVTASLLPLWFLEGDAVFAESALTESGRGRSAEFQKQLKAIAVERVSMYNYDKIVNGSYRDFVPNHYESGFQMVTWAMAKYDHQTWNKVLNYTATKPFTLNPVNFSLSRSTGLKKRTLFKEAFDSLKTIWIKDVSENEAIAYETLNPPKKEKYISYYSPVYTATDNIIAIKTSLTAPASFVLINTSDKTERTIHIPGPMYPWTISYGNGKLVWVETQSDPRWENRNYSVIKAFDLNGNKVIRLSHKTRYLSASVSPDGKKIATVENSISNINNLVIIQAETGMILQTVHAPENAYLQRPQWSDNGEKISVIFLTEEGEGIMTYTQENQKWKILVEADREDLQSSFIRNDTLFFISSRSGTENLYLRTPDNKIATITRSRFGATDLCLVQGKAFFSDYSALGNSICSTPISVASENNIKNTSLSSFLINRVDIEQKSDDHKAGNVYIPEPYRKWQHLFRFHSWMPFYADIEEIKADPASVRPGISIMSQNQLSTLISTIGYEYSYDKKHVFHSRITWKGWYPVVESQLNYGNEPLIDKTGEDVGNPSDIKPGVRFLNSVSVPLSFTSGKFSEYIRPSFTSDYRNKYVYVKEEGIYDNGQTILTARLYFSNYHRSALRDIYPRWAQILDLNYSFAPFDKIIYGTSVSMKSSFYFPGFFPNNGIKIRYEKEKQIPAKYLFGNRVSFPRGYNNIYSKELELVSVDYVMPLVYPDINLASLLYLKRIRTGLFYDYGSGTGNYHYSTGSNGTKPEYFPKESFRSFGFELLADFHVLRIPYMISGGVQTAWKNISETPTFELLFNIDLFGMSIGRNPL